MTDHPRFDIDSPRDWQGSDRRASNGDEYVSVFNVDEWRRTFSPPESLTVETRDTDRAPAAERWPTLVEIGLAEALDQLEAVAAANQGKHPKLKWLTYRADQHDGKCLRHLGSAMYGNPNDDETGLPHRAHAGLRCLMALGQELLAK